MSNHVELPIFLDEVSLPETLPPLMIVAFTRPDLLSQVLPAIRQQSLLPQNIIAFVDGPRKADDEPLIRQCIELLKAFSTFIPVHIVARTKNLGCDQNVISGLTEVFSTYDSLVYLEDDTVPNPHFYDRMCRLLSAYRDCQQVGSVSAYANFPSECDELLSKDFMISNRLFSWGFGTWRDRWNELNLAHQPAQYNPFGSFYKIPATKQTKMTMINQFWLEKKQQTDWVITFTVASLYHQKVHIIPTTSLVYNIGFGHPESKTYKGQEEAWVNSRYDAEFCPNSLPSNLELSDCLKLDPENVELAEHLWKNCIWLSPSALVYLLQKYGSFRSMILFLKIFVTRLPVLLRRWRNGLPI
ncbi:sugar transferase [Planktothrix pseudagardhii]|uniref:Sugar transferase n=1 Tax=Planktothrix pseudagardhii TaxID=132604 RepID=A0A9W4CM03_9CYAN|nr:sugar transferase [Planktothrix pseudagardhii]CAD5955288.1 Sugar transferase [Planktothrix pseudagardhii]